MNLTDAIGEVRTLVDDPLVDRNGVTLAVKFQDSMIVTALQAKLRSLSRIQISRDVGFHNFSMVLRSEDATQPIKGLWQWPLPTWVAKIAQVRILNMGGPLSATTQPTFSPYLWTTPPDLSEIIFQKASKVWQQGWAWEGNRTFRAWGLASAPNFLLQVAKTPSRLFRAVLDQDPTAKNTLYLPAELDLGKHDAEEGAYVNTEVEVTLSGTIENIGLKRRCVYSASTNLDDARTTAMWIELPFLAQLEAGDKIESAIPLGEEHCHLLNLLAAQWIFEQTANMPAQKAIADDLRMELQAFTAYVSPRDSQGPEFFQGSQFNASQPYDSDRANYFSQGLGP